MSSFGRKVLVVDDNVDGAEMLSMLIGILGHDTRTANNGLTAIEIAKTYQPEVILLDLGLPEIDGIEVCRRLRADPQFSKTTIIALTGWGGDEDRRKTSEAGFDRHLVKPVESGALEEVLRSLD